MLRPRSPGAKSTRVLPDTSTGLSLSRFSVLDILGLDKQRATEETVPEHLQLVGIQCESVNRTSSHHQGRCKHQRGSNLPRKFLHSGNAPHTQFCRTFQRCTRSESTRATAGGWHPNQCLSIASHRTSAVGPLEVRGGDPCLCVCQALGALVCVSPCGSILDPFWVHLGPFGVILGPFWVHFGSI